MDLINVQQKIEEKISTLEKARAHLKASAEHKAEKIAEYERELMKTIVQLKLGGEFEIDNIKIKEESASNVEKVARGIVWKERLEMEKAESRYKSGLVYIEALKAELNGYQSIFRYMDTTTK